MFHRRIAKEGMEVEVEVELQEGKMKEEVGKAEEQGLWKTVQRMRRLRKNFLPTQGAPSGSRFTVLNVDVGLDEGGQTVEGVRNEMEMTTCVPLTKGPGVETNTVQKKQGKNCPMGDGNKGAENSRSRDMGGSLQESKKVLGEKNSKGMSVSKKGDHRGLYRWPKRVVGVVNLFATAYTTTIPHLRLIGPPTRPHEPCSGIYRSGLKPR